MIKKMYPICFLFLCGVASAVAQAPVIKWQNAAITDVPKVDRYEEDGYVWYETSKVYENLLQLIPTADGNFMGVVSTYRTGYEFKLVKFAPNGDTIFVKMLKDFEVSGLKPMAATPDGGFILIGYSRSQPYPYPISVLKVDAAGNTQWSETYRGGNANGVTVYETAGTIIATAGGGYLFAAGSSHEAGNDKTENSRGGVDFWIVKMDATGIVEWDKTLGGSNYDEPSLIIQASDGSYLIAGNSQSPVSGDKSENQKGGTVDESTGINYNKDFWLVKISVAGAFLWDKTIGGSKDERVTVLTSTADGGFILGGQSESGMDYDKTSASYDNVYYGQDMWVLKCNTMGTIQWQQGLGGDGSDYLITVKELADGSYIVGSSSSSGIGGTKTVQGYDDNPNNGNADYWITHLSTAGNALWQTVVGGTSGESLGAIVPTADGGLLLAGISGSGISGDRDIAQKGAADLWFVKLGEAELPVSLLSFTGHKVNGEAKLAWATATEENFSHFDLQKQDAPGHFTNLATIPAKGNSSQYNYTDKLMEGINYYRLKMVEKDGSAEYSGIVSIKEDAASKISLQPNPVSNGIALVVKIPVAAQQSYMQVIALDGKVLAIQNIAAGSTMVRLNTDALAKGTYFLKYVNNTGQQLQRFVKQ